MEIEEFLQNDELEAKELLVTDDTEVEDTETEPAQEAGPISESGAKKFVFELPDSPGEVFEADFLDGTTAEVQVTEDNAGQYAFVGKSSTAEDTQIFELFPSEPSDEEAMDVLSRIKSPQHGQQ